MAKKKIREFDGKHMLLRHIFRLAKIRFSRQLRPVQVTAAELAEWKKLKTKNPWLSETPLVVKPDMLFGKRGKYGLVKVNATLEEAKAFVQEHQAKQCLIEKVEGDLTHWLLEPFVKHEHEFYFSITSGREETHVYFSPQGGIEVEENWENMRVLSLAVGDKPADAGQEKLDAFYKDVDASVRPAVEAYVNAMFDLFEELDFVSLETNPVTFVKAEDENELKQKALYSAEQIADEGEEGWEGINGWLPIPLDLCAELDDTAHFKQTKTWGDLEFPDVFGHSATPAERKIEEMDAKTGASLKLSVLTPAPTGRVWALVAGGGASVIFADTVVDMGYGHMLGNYGEYSGAPNSEQMYHYTRTVLELATEKPDGQGRVLLVGGGIANFTDVAKTFKGIIHALREFKDQLKEAKMRIFVRRAGPNYRKGLQLMEEVGKELDVPMLVFGPERTMTEIVPLALKYIDESTTK
mmetsp:Transcript_9811/g.39825  ORF Transcript_9811/g.39825 Transcript_9811/m.39825 type:complete len:466 (-) Transcript_9811:32-1429(-)